MIVGAKYWNDRDCYYIQTNNPTEEMLRKNEDPTFLESCGPTASVDCLAVHYSQEEWREEMEVECPGGYRPQPEEILTDWFNDPRNYPEMQKARDDIGPRDLPGNRVPQYYVPAVRHVFGVEVEFTWIATHHQIADYFREGCSVQLCLKRPGHYVAGVAYDLSKSEIIINDPWPNRFADGNGWNRRHPAVMENLKPFAVIYRPKPKHRRRVRNV